MTEQVQVTRIVSCVPVGDRTNCSCVGFSSEAVCPNVSAATVTSSRHIFNGVIGSSSSEPPASTKGTLLVKLGSDRSASKN